jgi:hypothetical protein
MANEIRLQKKLLIYELPRDLSRGQKKNINKRGFNPIQIESP